MSIQVDRATYERAPREAPRDNRVSEKLIRKASRGNRAALKEICEYIARHVTFCVMRKLKSRSDVEDVVQEILLRVCEGIHTLRDPRAFGGWLNTIINNETCRFLSKNKKHGVVISMDEYLDSIVVDDEDDYFSEDYVMKEEERRAVITIIDTLPERQLEAVMLYYYEGMSVTETAKSMGISKQVVSIHLARAKEKIRKVYTKGASEPEKTAAPYGIASMSAGALISQALIQEAALVPVLSKATIDIAYTAGLARSSATTTGATNSITTQGMLLGLVGLLSTFALTIGLVSFTWISSEPEGTVSIGRAATYPVLTQGDIVFSGGETEFNTLNPTQADAWATNGRGELEANRWWISPRESDVVLYKGTGALVDESLSAMQASNEDGEYTLWFAMEDLAGSTYTLHRHFTIQTTQTPEEDL